MPTSVSDNHRLGSVGALVPQTIEGEVDVFHACACPSMSCIRAVLLDGTRASCCLLMLHRWLSSAVCRLHLNYTPRERVSDSLPEISSWAISQEQSHLFPLGALPGQGCGCTCGGWEGVLALDWGLGWGCHIHGHSWSHRDPDGARIFTAISRRRNHGRRGGVPCSGSRV